MPKQRRGLATNPLDAVIPAQPLNGTSSPNPKERVEKARCTFHLPVSVASKARDVAWWTPGLTLAGLVEEALGREITRREKERGEPFPPRKSELSPGGLKAWGR